MDAYRWKIFAKDSWIFQLFGSNGSVIGRIIREITYSPTLFIFYLFAYCIHFVRRKSYMYIYFCKIYIFLDLQERKVHSLSAYIFVW